MGHGTLKHKVIFLLGSPLREAVKELEVLKEELEAGVPVYLVDAHNIVPAWVASDKEEIGARTLRPKIHNVLDG